MKNSTTPTRPVAQASTATTMSNGSTRRKYFYEEGGSKKAYFYTMDVNEVLNWNELPNELRLDKMASDPNHVHYGKVLKVIGFGDPKAKDPAQRLQPAKGMYEATMGFYIVNYRPQLRLQQFEAASGDLVETVELIVDRIWVDPKTTKKR